MNLHIHELHAVGMPLHSIVTEVHQLHFVCAACVYLSHIASDPGCPEQCAGIMLSSPLAICSKVHRLELICLPSTLACMMMQHLPRATAHFEDVCHLDNVALEVFTTDYSCQCVIHMPALFDTLQRH